MSISVFGRDYLARCLAAGRTPHTVVTCLRTRTQTYNTGISHPGWAENSDKDS